MITAYIFTKTRAAISIVFVTDGIGLWVSFSTVPRAPWDQDWVGLTPGP